MKMNLAVLLICDRVFDADLGNGIRISYTSKQKLKERKVVFWMKKQKSEI